MGVLLCAKLSQMETRTCPECKLTEQQLYNEGLMGCATCYSTFVREVRLAVEKLHGVSAAPEKNPWPTRRADSSPS
jgi:protein-arginine kinase activator protein McsA